MDLYEKKTYFSLDGYDRNRITDAYKKCGDENRYEPYKTLINYSYEFDIGKLHNLMHTDDFILYIQIMTVSYNLHWCMIANYWTLSAKDSIYHYSYKNKSHPMIIYKKMPIKLGMLRDVDFKRI